ncbi:MAG: hypothetical protein J6V14_03320, partial [Clostridia bacterium]|nr:hypothetical protein [Clostridia bacterium]
EGLPFLNKNHGWLVYFAHLAGTGIIAVTLCYIKPIINAIRGAGKKKAAEPAENAAAEVDAEA